MRALILLLAATAMSVTAPAAAQHQGHHMPQPAKPKPKPAAKKPAPKKPAPKKPAAKKPATKKPAAKSPAKEKPAAEKPVEDPHAGHAKPEQTSDPHAGHAMPEQQVDPHAGHGMPEHQADPHAGHDVTASQVQPPVAPPPPEALQGPEHAADLIFGTPAMDAAREELRREHGALPAYRIFVERAETSFRRGRDGYLLDAQAWYGGDIDKLWVKGEVEGNWRERPEHVEVQALWSHAIDPWFDVQTGIRYDPKPGGPDRAHLVLGLQGLAPYWWEVDTALFVSNKGEVTARAEAEYDLRITQKLILQPRGELNFAFQNVRELGIGSGLSNAVGLRLRYQVSQLFAPYVGVEYERAFGRTAKFRRDEGERAGTLHLLAGLRFWF